MNLAHPYSVLVMNKANIHGKCFVTWEERPMYTEKPVHCVSDGVSSVGNGGYDNDNPRHRSSFQCHLFIYFR